MIQPRTLPQQTPLFQLWLAALALLLLTFVFNFFPVKNYDIFWHLKAGDLIRATKTLPSSDIFSHTTPNLRWNLTSWGSDLLFSYIYRYAGKTTGLVIFKCLLLTLVYALLLLTMNKQNQRSYLLLPGLWLLSLIIGKDSFLVRPQLFSYLFLAVYYFLLDYYRRPVTVISYRMLLLFPMIMVIWSNLHPGFAIGYLFLFTFLVLE